MGNLISVNSDQLRFCQPGLEVFTFGDEVPCYYKFSTDRMVSFETYHGERILKTDTNVSINSDKFAASVLTTIEMFFNNDVVKCKKLKTAGVGIIYGNSDIPIWIIPDPRPDLTEYEYRKIDGKWRMV